jgi:hypothetical protein
MFVAGCSGVVGGNGAAGGEPDRAIAHRTNH